MVLVVDRSFIVTSDQVLDAPNLRDDFYLNLGECCLHQIFFFARCETRALRLSTLNFIVASSPLCSGLVITKRAGSGSGLLRVPVVRVHQSSHAVGGCFESSTRPSRRQCGLSQLVRQGTQKLLP